MAKVSFAKLGIKTDSSIEKIQFGEHTIEVKKYLPMQEKMEMISNIINLSADENRFYNPMKLDIFTALEIMDNYTNISFTEKQKDNPAKLYDELVSSGLYNKVLDAITAEEWYYINNTLTETVQAIYSYQNSAMGILDTISQDYSGLKFDAEGIQKLLADPNNLSMLKDVLTKLG